MGSRTNATHSTAKIANTLSRKLRTCLTRVGLSPDEHIDEVNFDYFTFFTDQESIKFLKIILAFCERLDPLERLIFTREFLEKGRHSSYWWLFYFKQSDYHREVERIKKKVGDDLGGYLA